MTTYGATGLVSAAHSVKKILLIAYHYYPDLAIGAQRTVKFAKYLPQFGWQPEVLTVHQRYYPQRDEAPLGFDCPVYRTSKWPLPDHLYKTVRKWFSAPSSRRPAVKHPPGAASKAPHQQGIPRWKKFLNTLSSTPDDILGWYPPAVAKAWRLVKKQKYDAIYTSGPPHSCHLVGLTVHRLTGVPWVADFRDPWLYPKQKDNFVLEISKEFDRRYEAKTARNAALVLTTTDEWRDHLIQLYSPWLDDKCHTVINGFDEDDFDESTASDQKQPDAPVTFLYAGNLYSGRDPAMMLVAAGELIAQGVFSREDVAFEFYGNYDIDMARMQQVVADFDLEAVVRFNTPVSRDSYLRLLRSAEVLVLIQADFGRVHIPAKAFEYLGTGNGILTLTSEGATRNFMSRFDQTAIAPLDDKDRIKEAMKKLFYQARNRDKTTPPTESLQGITRRHLTGKFSSLLDKIVVGDGRSG